MLVLPRRYGQQKPPLGARIAWGHPLARRMHDCLLFQEGGGLRAENLASPQAIATGAAAPGWAATQHGPAAYFTGGSGFDIPTHGNLHAGDFTYRFVIVPNSWPSNYTTVLSESNRIPTIMLDTIGRLRVFEIDGTTEDNLNRGAGSPVGVVTDNVITRIGSTLQYYVNGVAAGATFTNAATNAPSGVLSVGRDAPAAGASYDGKVISVQTWMRALSPAEVMWLYVEPYAFLSAPRRLWVDTAAAAGGQAPRSMHQYRQRRVA